MISSLKTIDHKVSARMANSKPPRWFRILVISLTRAGDAWAWLACGAVALYFGGQQVLDAAALAVLLEVCLFVAIKRTVKRPRPAGASWHRLRPIDSFSFPSGHATTGFTVAAALAVWFPGHVGILLLVAALVSASRVATNQHFVSDVIAGAFLGAGIGVGVSELIRFWG